eukprot:scaffold34686_cov160-Amphora_coffeaeformis.AAC.3
MPRSSTSSAVVRSSSRSRGGDSSIRRGAAVIRQEITKQFNLTNKANTTDPSIASLETDFSDIWPHKMVEPRMSPPRSAPNDESMTYSVETTPDDIRTFASRGDAAQWAKGSLLISPESPPPSPPSWSPSPPVEYYRKKPLGDENRSYDFIENDYVEEFELDDYDEVCHPQYSRHPKTILRRMQTPPASKPPKPVTPQKPQRATKVTPEKVKVVSKAAPKPLVPPTAVFEERRQGPPSPANSSAGSIDQQHAYFEVPNPLDGDFDLLMRDPAYQHAQRAGHLWQSLVGHHIRFPSRWWNGARTPPLGMDIDARWQYFGRYASRDKQLRRFVSSRAAPGRLLLHIVMLDLVTCKPLQDICVGCFHPSARGIRTTERANPSWDGVRDLWLAVRKRAPGVSVMDSHLQVVGEPTKGPLGNKYKVSNQNVRAVFGEEPPVETLFVPESYLYELYMAAVKKHADKPLPPPMVLLQEFVLA